MEDELVALETRHPDNESKKIHSKVEKLTWQTCNSWKIQS
jgi:hypothetical protein